MAGIDTPSRGIHASKTDIESSTFALGGHANASSDDISDDVTLVDGTVEDAKDMRRMGKIQELRRNFRAFSAIAFTCCVMGTWEILYLQNTPALIDGGKAGMFWAQIWVYVGQTFIVLSLAEMSSMAPTAGGQYHWVSEFAPPRAQKVLSYISGWMSMLAWQLFIAADSSLCASLVLALVSVNNPDFVVRPFMNTLLITAFALVGGLANIFGIRHFPKFEGVFVFLHVSCFFAIVAVLWRYGVRAATAHDVFLDFADNNEPGMGWPAIGLTLLVGQAPALFTVQGSDSVAHIAEEVKDAGAVVPRAMLTAFFANIPFAVGILVTYIYTLGDVGSAISSPTGFPFVYALQACLSTPAVTGLVFIMLLLMFFILLSCMTSAARQTYAFARDGGVPFSRWVARVDGRWEVPANAVLVTAAFTVVMSLIYLGSPVAFNAFISTSVVALMATYAISIGCVLLRRLRADYFGGRELPKARWSLGRLGVPVNVLGVLFCVESFFWCFWPASNTTDPTLFNWGVVIFGAIALIALVQFLLVARRSYEGPVAKVRRE